MRNDARLYGLRVARYKGAILVGDMTAPFKSERLLVVEDAFIAGSNGVLVAPRFVVTSTEPREVRLVRPDQTTAKVRATISVSHIRGPLAPWGMFRLHDVTVDDVPIGTELWSI